MRRLEVVLVRHGETDWSRAGRHTGWTDIPLTDVGRAQARALGDLLRGRDFASVLTSPLQRAAETCRLAGYGDSTEIIGELREWDYGAYEGRTTPDIRRDVPGWTVWTHGVVGGESIEQVASRADAVIERVRGVEGDVALFAHGHVLRILAARWCDLDATAARHFMLDTATISILAYERETPAIRSWNEGRRLE
ncbi:MAG: histidine phosphatase family protein [Actinomycetota bacterium]|nr:histidine phosphatase family protein [Actinomycetota bacterium]